MSVCEGEGWRVRERKRERGAFILMGHPHTLSPDSTLVSGSVHWDSPSLISLSMYLFYFLSLLKFLSLERVLVGQVRPPLPISPLLFVGVGLTCILIFKSNGGEEMGVWVT